MSTIEPSYFLDVVRAEKYLGQLYHQSAFTRDSDKAVLAFQRPLGWSFFSHSNVAFLLGQCRRVYKSIEFTDIADVMVEIYDQFADEMYMAPTAGPNTYIIEKLNEMFFQLWIQRVNANTSDERMYMQYLGDPNVEPNYPENVKTKDKTVMISERDLTTYGDGQGVHFNAEDDSLARIIQDMGASPTRVVIGSLEDELQRNF